MISVVIGVGPNPAYKLYFQDCINSLKEQRIQADEILIIDDMANVREWDVDWGKLPVRIWETPWLSGVPHVYNFGISLAENELVIILGCDDMLMPHAIRDAVDSFNYNGKILALYYFDLIYSDSKEIQKAPCGCAMFTKTLWRYTGGYPVQSSVGACDHIFISRWMNNPDIEFINIESESPAYFYRRHDQTATNTQTIGAAVAAVKGWLDNNWNRPEWGRYGRNNNEQTGRRIDSPVSFKWQGSRR